jgi:hypothetical protein
MWTDGRRDGPSLLFSYTAYRTQTVSDNTAFHWPRPSTGGRHFCKKTRLKIKTLYYQCTVRDAQR